MSGSGYNGRSFRSSTKDLPRRCRESELSKLEDLVEDDVFTATVTVVGSYSYDTQAGDNTTVPQLHVDPIKQIGHN